MSPATWRTIFLTAVGIIVLWLGYMARAVVTPLLVALVLAYMLDPVVRVLERRGLSRRAASGLVVVVALAAMVTIVAMAATRIAAEASEFYSDVAGEPYEDAARRVEFEKASVGEERDEAKIQAIKRQIRVGTWDDRAIVYLDANLDGVYQPGYAALAVQKVKSALKGSPWADPVGNTLQGVAKFGPDVAKSAGAALSGLAEGSRAAVAGIIGLLTIAILFPIYLFYSLVNLSRVYDVVVRHLPEGRRARIVGILHQIHETMSSFFRGRLILMFVKGALLLALFLACGVPFAFVCAGFAALASLIPLVGGLAAGIPPILLALPNSSGATIVTLAVGILLMEGIEGYVLIPKLIGGRVGLHPLTVLVCTLVAFDLLGFFGMIVAVPLTAVLKILASEFVLPEVRRRAGLAPRGDAVAHASHEADETT